jgi:hypothetical protein
VANGQVKAILKSG